MLKEDIDIAKLIVREILLKNENARDNDPTLYIEYLKSKGIVEAEKQIEAFITPNTAKVMGYNTISRTRRKIQEEAKKNGDTSLLSTGQVMKLRRELEDEYYQYFKN